MDFHDQNGRATHYIDQGGVLYTWAGMAVGVLYGSDLYDNQGNQIGIVESGWIRDLSGDAVAFARGASGGPLPPVTKVQPVKGVPEVPPVPAVPAIPQVRAVPSLRWSGYSLDDILHVR
ncbi:hypothetical protein Rleg9DRAFT_1713 [Rhizobium leguminosarum bv. trifolii WSM597]|uniref:4-fold beta flower domain-containing protein n=1 Tax=Rhizobium leguminosarum bv. trifolii WSM597 TaxID=754764 RepID=I9N4T4_RHILT|nr:hypothetical protein Rleg9DRAFT_1713 [Rhizobium leguminosarum bv. trifolii WSM597]